MLLFQDFESQIAVFFYGEAAWYKVNQSYNPVYFEARDKRPGHGIYRARRSRHGSRCPEACLQTR